MPERLALSLRSRLLLGLLLPLLLLIGANAWFAYDRAVQAANEAYDRSLYLAARTLAEDLQWQEGRLTLQMRPGTGYLFENHTGSRLFYQVSDVQGHALLGAQDLPAPGANVERVHFFALVEFADTRYNDVPVRLARLTHVLPTHGMDSPVLHVTVAETREAREALIQTILLETLGSQALLLVAAAVFVSLAVRRAVRPLHQLRDLIEAKADDDLRSLPDRAWPPELQPLVGAINGYTQRLGRLIGIRKRFLDNAAHQLRTPLTALKTQLGLMQRQSAAPHDPALLQAAQRTTDDAVRLTAQLLSLTRAEHGPDMDKRAEVELVALARQVTEDHLWRSHERGDDLGFEALSSRVLVHGNALLLQEALANLIDNAMHHGGRGVHITVRVGPQSLEVEDNGPGIAPEHQAHVFERFYRAAAAGVSGSGLGLAIVQEIARQHGAQVQVHSPVHDGRGTRIRLYWPA
ncbi:MAG: Sensor protein QseC [Pseudomonadota bacterium]|jgi:two-component system sensor histidine kinase TctE